MNDAVPFSDPHRGPRPLRLLRGASYVGSAFVILLGVGRLLRYAVGLIALNAVLLVGMVVGAWQLSSTLVAWLFGDPHGGWAWLTWALLLSMLLVVGYGGFLVVSSILGSPLIDYLSLRTEENERGIRHDGKPFELRAFLSDVAYGLSHTLLNVGLYVLVMAPLFVINFVPYVGSVIYMGVGGFATAVFAAREFMDAPASRRRIPYVVKLRNVLRNGWLCLGFGAACGLLLAIPVVNFFVVPVAVVGGTRLFLHLEHYGHLEVPARD